jgi:hypothetical protein
MKNDFFYCALCDKNFPLEEGMTSPASLDFHLHTVHPERYVGTKEEIKA